MVGHTAVREAVIKAVETLDREVGRVLDVAEKVGFSVILTADHGNCDEMVDPITQDRIHSIPCIPYPVWLSMKPIGIYVRAAV
jgi:2,3-bisphosphoglycerate-independent phosphoglycerate mutase